MQIIWAVETKDDFRRIDDFLNPINRKASQRAVLAIREQVKILIDNPEAGTGLDDDTPRRELYINFGKRGYVLRYVPDYETQKIYILRVWHGLEKRN